MVNWILRSLRRDLARWGQVYIGPCLWLIYQEVWLNFDTQWAELTLLDLLIDFSFINSQWEEYFIKN